MPHFAPWFWPLVEDLPDDPAALAERFQALTRERLEEFARQYERARSCIHPIYHAGSAVDYRDDREGHGDVFAAGVVGRGRAFWEEVRRDPGAFRRAADAFGPAADDFLRRRPDVIASSVLHARCGG